MNGIEEDNGEGVNPNRDLDGVDDGALPAEKPPSKVPSKIEKTAPVKRLTKHMKKFPELYRSDVSINPSYTGLKTFPYYVVCRRRFHKNKIKMIRQMNKEILHIAMMQTYAIDSVRVDRVFSVCFPPEATVVPDFASDKERRRIRQIMGER